MTYQEILDATQKKKAELRGMINCATSLNDLLSHYVINNEMKTVINILAEFYLNLLYKNIDEIEKEYEGKDSYELIHIVDLYMRYCDMLQGDTSVEIQLDELPPEANIFHEE